ncbi:MAG: hypothetical protein ACJ8C4_05830 [Gemmataceae bacterium]
MVNLAQFSPEVQAKAKALSMVYREREDLLAKQDAAEQEILAVFDRMRNLPTALSDCDARASQLLNELTNDIANEVAAQIVPAPAAAG